MPRPKRVVTAIRRKLSPQSKTQRDAIRARMRAAMVADFGTINAFRESWPPGSRAQQVAEAVYRFLQDQARKASEEKSKDMDLSTALAFAELTGRSAGFLLTGKGPERDGETRPRQELADDVATALAGAVPEVLREHGVRVDGLSALAFLWIKIQNTSQALAPLVDIGSALSESVARVAEKKRILASIEAASRNVTADCPGLLSLEPSALLRQAIAIPLNRNVNPALKPTVEGMLALARARAHEAGMDDVLAQEMR
jgi:hypothetical protein